MQLALAPLRRIGRAGDTTRKIDLWSWDFVVDGQSIAAQIDHDIIGVFGSTDHVWNDTAARKLMRNAAPDLPPNRVALCVCPECGGISCGAATAAVDVTDDAVLWREFRWEYGWEGAPDVRNLAIGPFQFARVNYFALINAAALVTVDANTDRLAAS